MRKQRPVLVIINDEDTIRQRQVEAFAGQPFQVHDYGQSTDALRGLAIHGADVIILDWTNPPLDKIELYRHLRHNYSNAAIVYVSPHDDVIKISLSDEAISPDDIIGAPVSPAEITARVAAVVAQREITTGQS